MTSSTRRAHTRYPPAGFTSCRARCTTMRLARCRRSCRSIATVPSTSPTSTRTTTRKRRRSNSTLAPAAAPALSSPRVVTAERPDVPFGIAAGEAATAVLPVLDVDDDLGARGLRLHIYGVGICDDRVDGLCLGAADLIRLLQQPPVGVVADRSEHDHPVAEAELGVRDPVFAFRNDEHFFEAERLAQPFDRRGGVA